MKLFALLMLVGCACAAVPRVVPPTPGTEQAEQLALEILKQSHPVESRNWLIDQAVNLVVNQAINFIRLIINDGSSLLGIPPLDPIAIDNFHLYVPAGLINLDLELEDIHASGYGGFVARRSRLNIRTLVLDLEIAIPRIHITSKYDLTGDFFTAIPLYGKGDAEFIVEDFMFRAILQLKQSDDGESVVIDSISDIFFEIPSFTSNLTGVIGGGDIDAIVNAIIEEVLIGYVNRFHGAIGHIAGSVVTLALNPLLEQLDTWRFLAPFV